MSKKELYKLLDETREDPSKNPEIAVFLDYLSKTLAQYMFGNVDMQKIYDVLGQFKINEASAALQSAGRLVMAKERNFNIILRHLKGYED